MKKNSTTFLSNVSSVLIPNVLSLILNVAGDNTCDGSEEPAGGKCSGRNIWSVDQKLRMGFVPSGTIGVPVKFLTAVFSTTTRTGP